MSRSLFLWAAAGLLAASGQAAAQQLCTPTDSAPAATLVLPYFEVDISDADGNGTADCGAGRDTLFSVTNAGPDPALAHVTLWTDWGVPTIDFDVFLTGYDVQTISLCQVIGLGRLPVTADEARDPNDAISPHAGTYSDNPAWDASFPSCAGVLPFPSPALTASLFDRVQNGHAGYPVAALSNQCIGEGLNGATSCVNGSCPPGTIARGYATIDSVNSCSIQFPMDAGYFVDQGAGVANNRNVLWGDWFIMDRANDFAQGDHLIHVQASDDLDAAGIPLLDPTGNTVATVANTTGYTFYGRYPSAAGGIDNREPLGTQWASRIVTFDSSSYFYWRDTTATVNPTTGYNCGLCQSGAGPGWCPLQAQQVVCWDESEDSVDLTSVMASVAGLAAGRIDIGTAGFSPPSDFGWCFLNLNHPGGFGTGSNIAQSYVGALHSALGRFSVGDSGIALRTACQDVP